MTVALVASGLSLSLSLPVHAACQAESVELPVKMVGSRAVVEVGINGTSVPLMVDSGAAYSMLTDAVAAQLKLPLRYNFDLRVKGLTGAADAQVTTVDKLQLLKGEIKRVDFIVGGNELGAGTVGLMGRNILSFADTEYDLAHGVIRFLFPNDDCARSNLAYWAGSTPVTEVELLSDRRGKLPPLRVDVRLNGKAFVALLDSGATTTVSERAARRAGVEEASLKLAGTATGVGSGSTKLWTAPFEKFGIGGETVLHNHLFVADIDLVDADMLLGIDFFLSHRIYVSRKQSKLFITYNGGPVFALDKTATASAEAQGTDAAAGDVQPKTADELARRGAASAARRDYASALADLDRACELEPSSAAFFAQRGAIQAALKRPAKAREDFDKALDLDPSQFDARFQRALLRLVAKDRDGAKADLDALDQALAPQAQMRFAMASVYMSTGQAAQALAQLNQWLPAHPHDVTRAAALNQRCRIRTMLAVELEQALDDCDDAVDSDSKNAAYLDSRGWVYLRLGKYKKAMSDFDSSLEYRPSNASSLYGRGLAKTRLGDAAEGSADLVAARKAQPDIDQKVPLNDAVAEAATKP